MIIVENNKNKKIIVFDVDGKYNKTIPIDYKDYNLLIVL